jgi:hypothetical protein
LSQYYYKVLLHAFGVMVLLNNVLLCMCHCAAVLTAAITYSTVKEYLKTAENDWPTMLKRLEAIRASLIKRNQFIINLTGVFTFFLSDRTEPSTQQRVDHANALLSRHAM